MEINYFNELNAIDVNKKTEKKNGLTYLSWAWAWGEVKKLHPNAQYKIYENADGWNYFTDGRTCWVKVSVTINDLEHIEYLPVMDNRNNSIPRDKVTSFDVNKAIQRAVTKACARHGLGLYIYAGEDLPEDAKVDDPDQSGSEDMGKGQKPQGETEKKEETTAPSQTQLDALKKVKRGIADVAKCFGIEEKDVRAKHVNDYISKVLEYQRQKAAEEEAKKAAAAEAEAQSIFAIPPDED